MNSKYSIGNSSLYTLKLIFQPIFLIFITSAIQSQVNNTPKLDTQTFSMFRESSYITFAGGVGNIENLVFEANIVPYYLFSLNQSDRWGIELSPQFILRMYNAYSFPVRTPSFMPRATFFYQFRKTNPNSHYKDLFGYFSWCHHSNGQENSFYADDSTTINTISGNFATNMIEIGLFMSKPNQFNPYSVNYNKFSVVYHYKHISELDNRFGDLRFFTELQTTINIAKTLEYFNLRKARINHHTSTLNVSTHIGWIAGNLNDIKFINIKRLIFKHTVSYKPPFLKDVTLFAQYYYGQDYYNIYFEHQLHVLRFGISAKPGSVF